MAARRVAAGAVALASRSAARRHPPVTSGVVVGRAVGRASAAVKAAAASEQSQGRRAPLGSCTRAAVLRKWAGTVSLCVKMAVGCCPAQQEGWAWCAVHRRHSLSGPVSLKCCQMASPPRGPDQSVKHAALQLNKCSIWADKLAHKRGFGHRTGCRVTEASAHGQLPPSQGLFSFQFAAPV